MKKKKRKDHHHQGNTPGSIVDPPRPPHQHQQSRRHPNKQQCFRTSRLYMLVAFVLFDVLLTFNMHVPDHKSSSTPTKLKHPFAPMHSLPLDTSIKRSRSMMNLRPPQPPTFTFTALEGINRTSLDGRIFFFLHIHKSGGTCMCSAARMNKMIAAETNCNPQNDQRCCGGNDSVEAQQRFARETNLTFVANEREMYRAAMDTELYRYIIMLRNSRDRYKSHWQHAYRNNKDVPYFGPWWQRQPDNWNTRMICGTACSNVAKYKLTKELYNYTVNRLLLFEHHLFVEDYNQSFVKFAKQVGWKIMPIPIRRNSQRFSYPNSSQDEVWDPKMSALDDALYEISRNIYDRRVVNGTLSLTQSTRENLEEYFREGPAVGCDTPCCAERCSIY